MTESDDLEFDAMIREGLGEIPAPDFEAWQRKNQDSVAYLNPVVTATYVRRRSFLLRLASGATAAIVILAASLWFFSPQKHAFAKTIEEIKQAKTMSWTIAWYNRIHSVDSKRTWLEPSPRWERSYLEPNRWRDVRYADDGTVVEVSIEDTTTGQVLTLDMQKRTAILSNEPSGQFGGGRPFDRIARILKSEPIEFVGQQDVNGITTNAFRHYRETEDGQGESTEIWLDAESKHLIKYTSTPGKDYFDPENAPDHNNKAEEQFSKGTIAGVIHRDIVFDAQLDPSLFSMTPPADFTIVDPPEPVLVNEEQMIQWLRLSAEANGGVFLELDRGFNMDWHNTIAEKPKSELSEAEQKYIEVAHRHFIDSNTWRPVMAFADSFTESKSFRYLGKGIKLGSKDRIVCFYKLKATGTYRAVYGDLSVEDIELNELPLPVE